MDNKNLAPCYACRRTDELDIFEDSLCYSPWQVGCAYCGCMGSQQDTKEEAIASWNNRPTRKELELELINQIKNNFPSIIRKMWSAGEIIKWLEKYSEELRRNTDA